MSIDSRPRRFWNDVVRALARADRPVIEDTSARRRGIGRWLRWCAGVNEDVLRWIPFERPRYTTLGAIVLVIALLDFLALLALPGFPWIGGALFALTFASLVLGSNRFALQRVSGATLSRRLRSFIPSIALSVMTGLLCADPLLLKVFAPEIEIRAAALGLSRNSLGILQQEQVLNVLASENRSLAVGSWLLRMFFVLIQILPFLMSIPGGSTVYDRVLARLTSGDAPLVKASEDSVESDLVEVLLARIAEMEASLEAERANQVPK
jgi:hypothetical protein